MAALRRPDTPQAPTKWAPEVAGERGRRVSRGGGLSHQTGGFDGAGAPVGAADGGQERGAAEQAEDDHGVVQ
ncbi:hypothetical protein GCM10010430_02960 [Kitasatospora cystarginea]|uniref:Uncharacterized protein n=1 Tax=Kitasatospora cystarginea TaxID=58350 RepID=A0ABP5Q663_9ACTN